MSWSASSYSVDIPPTASKVTWKNDAVLPTAQTFSTVTWDTDTGAVDNRTVLIVCVVAVVVAFLLLT